LVRGKEVCESARWGWPANSPNKGILTHARRETADALPTWREAWWTRRGVIPVVGWHEGSWQIDAPGAHVAVLWTDSEDGLRFAVLTQDPAAGCPIDRLPIPLSLNGALDWLGGGGLDEQVQFRIGGNNGQETFFSDL
jgi:hypothetical protein